VALRAATPRTVLPPAATASRSAAATSNAARGAPPESRAERTAAGRPNRIASRGVAAAEAVGCFVAACVGFAFAFRVGAGFRLGVTIGFATERVVRDGVVDVVTGRGVGVGLDRRATAGEGVAVALLMTTRGFVATGAADEPTTGASGVGTVAFVGEGAGVVPCEGFDDFVANAPGGSSGAGIGVPPAAQPAAGQANAARQAPTASESRLGRRDDVHLDTTSPLSESHGTSVDARVSTRARVAAGGRRPPCLACT